MQNCFNLLICDLESKKPFEKGQIFIGLNTPMISINFIRKLGFWKTISTNLNFIFILLKKFHKPKLNQLIKKVKGVKGLEEEHKYLR